MPLLKFTEELIEVSKFDVECVRMADRHYSRQKPGTNQFLPPGRTAVYRSADGDVLIAWLWQQKRDDGEVGYNLPIFRNESSRRSSEIILESEKKVVSKWGPNRGFTYVDPNRVRHKRDPGRCFLRAGWKFVRVTKSGLHLLDKQELGS